MAEITTTQKQTTATPSPAGPAGQGSTSVGTTAASANTESGDLDRLLAAAFGEGTETVTETEEQEPSDENDNVTDAESEETEGGEPAEESDEEDEEETEESDEEAEDEEEDEVPKGMEKLPKGIVKRLQKQSAQIRDLKAALQNASSVKVAPTPQSPLADVSTLQSLDERVATAKAVKKYCQANPDGATLTRADGKVVELDSDEIAARLARAEAELEAFPDRKVWLQQRAQAKPWETAEKMAPDLFKKDSPANKFLTGVLTECPELTRLHDYEILIAAAAKGYKISLEEQSGKVKYVRMELDEKGNPKQPKAAGAQKTKPPITPSSTKPATRVHTKQTVDTADIYAKTAGNAEARLDAMLDAAFQR